MSSKGDIAVSVRGLSKSYTIAHNAQKHTTLGEALVHRVKNPLQRLEKETFWALKDVSFDMRKGDVVGIIGRNGAGKSTLLKILSRITKPTEGEVRLFGRVGSLLEVGTGFHPELTGRENIYLNGAILGMRKREIDRQFDAIVDFAEVEQFLDTPVKRYSSGMYVRLAFAVAAHLNPEILVVDEVLAVGDAQFQKKCLGKMKDVAETDGRTVLFVSHNMKMLEAICTSAILLAKGSIEAYGPTKEVAELYVPRDEACRARVRINTNVLKFNGLANGKELQDLSPDDDIDFQFDIQVGRHDLFNCHIDCALYDERGQCAIHTKSKYVSEGLSLHASERVFMSTKILSPKLAPGRYYLTIYIYSGNDVFLWIDDVEACRINAKSYFGIGGYIDKIDSVLIPEFSVYVKHMDRLIGTRA